MRGFSFRFSYLILLLTVAKSATDVSVKRLTLAFLSVYTKGYTLTHVTFVYLIFFFLIGVGHTNGNHIRKQVDKLCDYFVNIFRG